MRIDLLFTSAFELKRGPMTAAEKALECASIAIDTAESISKIMNTGPKNWREA